MYRDACSLVTFGRGRIIADFQTVGKIPRLKEQLQMDVIIERVIGSIC